MVPRVIMVVRHKSNVMKTFVDIPVASIRSMIAGMHKASAINMGQDQSVLEENSFVDFQNAQNNIATKVDIKSTEVPMNQPIKTTNVDEIMLRNEEEILKKKKEILGNADQGSKRLSLILITCFIIVVLAYFSGTIGIVLMMFNTFDEMAGNVRWAVLRQSAIMLAMFTMRELVIANTTKLEEDTEYEFSNLYRYERMIELIKSSPKGVYKNYKTLSERLDSDQFCGVIFENSAEREDCETFKEGSMLRGMQNVIYQLISYIKSLQNSYIQYKNTDYHFPDLLKRSHWDLASTFSLYL